MYALLTCCLNQDLENPGSDSKNVLFRAASHHNALFCAATPENFTAFVWHITCYSTVR